MHVTARPGGDAIGNLPWLAAAWAARWIYRRHLIHSSRRMCNFCLGLGLCAVWAHRLEPGRIHWHQSLCHRHCSASLAQNLRPRFDPTHGLGDCRQQLLRHRTVRSALSLGDFGSSALGYCWAARIGPSKHPHPCTQAKHSARLQRPCGPLGAAHCHPLEHETGIPNQNRPAFFNPGRGDLRWGLCGFGVYGANGRNRSELAVSATDDRCLGACGNHAGATDFGDAIRGISRRVSGRRALFGLYRRPPDALGDVPSLFFVDFSLCPAS